MEQKRPLLISVTAVLFFLLFALRQHRGRNSDVVVPTSSMKAFYTDDDGASTFEDDLTKVPPFDRGGKETVRAYLFSSHGKQFVGYLERYSPAAKARLANIKADPRDALAFHRLRNSIVPEVKRPQDASWVARDSTEGQKVIDVVAPDGSRDVEPVLP